MAKGKVNDGLQKQGNAEAESTEKGQVKDIAFVRQGDYASGELLRVLIESGADFDSVDIDTQEGQAIAKEHGIPAWAVVKKASDGSFVDLAALQNTDKNEDSIA